MRGHSENGISYSENGISNSESCSENTPELSESSDQRIAKGAGGKGPRQKTSKIVKKCQKVFRHFSTIFAQGKKRQKSSKSVKKFFNTFRQFSRRAKFFSGPFCNPLIREWPFHSESVFPEIGVVPRLLRFFLELILT